MKKEDGIKIGFVVIVAIMFLWALKHDLEQKSDKEQFLDYTQLSEEDHIVSIARYFELEKYKVTKCDYHAFNFTGWRTNKDLSTYRVSCHFRLLLEQKSMWLSKEYDVENNVVEFDYYD